MAFGIGLLTMLQNFLGVPLGAKWQKSNSPLDKGSNVDPNNERLKKNFLVMSIVDMTVDEICLGAKPLYYTHKGEIPTLLKTKYDVLLKRFNEIVRWIATDLLVDGVSSFKFELDKNKVLLYPYLDELHYFVGRDNKVYACDAEGKEVKDLLIFINYNKYSLSRTDDEGIFSITPRPVQLSNSLEPANDLEDLNNLLTQYRRKLSKIVRFAAVEVGGSQGGNIQDVIDTISSGINADPNTLQSYSPEMFDDEIPVFPVRKGFGEPKIVTDVPNFSIKDLGDYDIKLSNLLITMRFPKTYLDFSQASDATAVSLVRGDIRFNRLVKSTRYIIENTINSYIARVQGVQEYKIEYKLQVVPCPEDTDIVESIRSYQDFLKDAFDIINQAEDELTAMYYLQSYVDMLDSAANLKTIEKWIQDTRNYIKSKFSPVKSDEEPSEDSGSDFGDSDFGGSDFDNSDFSGSDFESPSESEAINSEEELDENEGQETGTEEVEVSNEEPLPNVRPERYE